MYAVVEIYNEKGELLERGPNMIVDGAAETIVDMLTISPTFLDIASASAILDTSNYMVQAMSFAKSASAYQWNQHNFRNEDNFAVQKVLIDGSFIGAASGGVSSYTPYFPDPPDTAWPTDTALQRRDAVTPRQADLEAALGDEIDRTICNQNVNPYVLPTGRYLQTTIGSPFAIMIGCYSASDAQTMVLLNISTGTAILNTDVSGHYNTLGVMDSSGFLNCINPAGVATFPDPEAGLVVSALADFSGTGEVIYTNDMSGVDMATNSICGGIQVMGLFTIDTRAMVANGINPPFATFDHINNTRIYRLFAKKVLATDLTSHSDDVNHVVSGLRHLLASGTKVRIVWRVFF